MAETKSFASLSSGLLARKGAAKPAMRPQGFGSFGGSLEDLGWNDMGHAPGGLHDIHEALPEHVPSSIEALTPAPGGRVQVEPPAVVEQQRELESRLAEPEPEPRAVEPAPQPRPARRAAAKAEVVVLPRSRAVAARAKAAFTLRLDPERHLKLRLACALSRRSAQQLVTEALDDFLDSLPELDALAGHVPEQASQR
ncbi:MAG TPA: hypothetical protein VF547_05540 [Allosphingosinicella sp.]|jgi:hypothetical protein